ncbi:General secretion pathway protein K [hydrothermal vent metagenome]|uniref:General secretion pathway protein K n=1 Tax=hydrothermal vent metagenome TaxID=652676 RepID=A0A3B0ZZW0_9ZZZZ
MVNIKQQRGVALLTVILIVTLISITAISMRAHQELDIRRTVNELNHAQAVVYLQGAEYLSKTVLKEDAKKSKIDTLDEDWAMVLPPFPVDGGTIGGILEDLSGKFNINNLVDAKGKKSIADHRSFQVLLVNLKLDADIADAVVDWIDKNETPEPGGAEDGYYLGKDKQPYRAANQLIASTTELLRVKGINFKVFNKIKNFITALPKRNSININTADKEVLRMISISISDADAQDMVKTRKKNGYKKVSDLLSHSSLSSLNAEAKGKLIKLDVKSDYFLLTSTAIIGQLEIRMKSILNRNDKKKVTVLVRSQGEL